MTGPEAGLRTPHPELTPQQVTAAHLTHEELLGHIVNGKLPMASATSAAERRVECVVSSGRPTATDNAQIRPSRSLFEAAPPQ